MNENEGRQRLAKAVKTDRMRLHRTVDRARQVAKISRGAWENVEAGRSVKEFTLGAIEEALEWPAGRAQQIIHGEAASELEVAVLASGLDAEAKEKILRIIAEQQPPPPHDGRGVRGA